MRQDPYIILGAIVYSAEYSGLGASTMIRETISRMEVSPWVVIILMQVSFYMKSVAPKEITLSDIYRAIVPFLGIQAIALIMLIVFPKIALWLPSFIFYYFQMLIQ